MGVISAFRAKSTSSLVANKFYLKINTQVVVVVVIREVKCLRICNLDPHCTLFFSAICFFLHCRMMIL